MFRLQPILSRPGAADAEFPITKSQIRKQNSKTLKIQISKRETKFGLLGISEFGFGSLFGNWHLLIGISRPSGSQVL